MPDYRWFVVHTYSGYENKVAANIIKVVENRKMADQIPDIKVPTETVTNIEDDKNVEKDRKLYPGYVLVKDADPPDENNRYTMSDDLWLIIRNTRGVTGFVGPEGKPVPLSEREVLDIGVEKKVVEVSYQVGDVVNIIDEIFDGFSGKVEEIDFDKGIVKVRVSALFGKETIVELELDQVEPVVE